MLKSPCWSFFTIKNINKQTLYFLIGEITTLTIKLIFSGGRTIK